MKILVQNQEAITTIDKEIWIAIHNKSTYKILHDTEDDIIGELGIYETKQRACEVIKEIFECMAAGMTTYIMPEK